MMSIAQRKARQAEYQKAYDAFIQCYPFTTEDLPGEEWRTVVNENYQISNYGRMRSFHKKRIRIMKPALVDGGYLIYMPTEDKRQLRLLAHRLVAEAFIVNPENKPQVNHRDGQKMNNHIANLEWVTVSENQCHALSMGLKKIPRGEENYQAGLTNEQAAWCRQVYRPGHPEYGVTALSRLFGLSDRAIRDIVHGNHYKTAGGQIHEVISKPRVPVGIRNEIKKLFVRRSREFGIYALSQRFGISHDTVQRIVKEK